MNVFGLTISRTKALPVLSNVDSRGGWFPLVREAFGGAWQKNIEIRTENVLTFHAAFACVSLISSDIAKLRPMLVQRKRDNIWDETENPAYSPVLRKPNRYQTHIQFKEEWVISLLVHGNTYVLKHRDQRNVVVAMYVLNPQRVRPLVAPDGSVFYQVNADQLSGIGSEGTIIPASEIIHDRINPLYHPLVGISPISACGLAAINGLRVQENSTNFFANGSNPGGVLTAPGVIHEETAKRLKENWESEFSGLNNGRVAVLGDGLKYERMSMSAVDSQLIDQLKITAEMVCTAFLVPPYMISVGPPPNYNNIEALSVQYYTQCLQKKIEAIEVLLDEGLGLIRPGEIQQLGIELDLDDLLRMDTASQVKAAADSIGSGAVSPNEARSRYFGLGPVTGGDSPYLQQQNYSLEALSKRDQQADPFGTTPPALPAPITDKPDDDDGETEKRLTLKIVAKALTADRLKRLAA